MIHYVYNAGHQPVVLINCVKYASPKFFRYYSQALFNFHHMCPPKSFYPYEATL